MTPRHGARAFGVHGTKAMGDRTRRRTAPAGTDDRGARSVSPRPVDPAPGADAERAPSSQRAPRVNPSGRRCPAGDDKGVAASRSSEKRTKREDRAQGTHFLATAEFHAQAAANVR